MKIKLTRESVCVADDCEAPHEKCITMSDDTTVLALARIIQRDYLPSKIQGGKATWSLVSHVPIAVLAQQWTEPRLLPFFGVRITELNPGLGPLKVHLNYHAQLDPEIVLKVLEELKLETIQTNATIASVPLGG